MEGRSSAGDIGEFLPSRRDAIAAALACLASRPAFAESKAETPSGPVVLQSVTSAPQPWTMLPPTPDLPHPDRSETLAINGTEIFYARFGSGPPIIMLHGGMGNSNYWGRQITHLADRFCVIAVDTRGHGRSPLTSPTLSYGLFAQDVVALMDALVIPKAAIVGWSDGAITGLELAMNHPSRVDRLFAFAGNVSHRAIRWGGGSHTFFDYGRRCKAEYAALSPDPDRWPEFRAALRSMWHLAPDYAPRELARIMAPTVIADSEHDEIIKPMHAAWVAGMIRSGQPLILPNTSHFAMLQDSDGFNAALDRFMAMAPKRMPSLQAAAPR